MYIFISLLYSNERRRKASSQVKTALESAANTYQWGLLQGLKDVSQGEEIKIINSVPMGVFPRHSKVLVEKSYIEHDGDFEIDNVGYLNLPIIKQRQRSKGIYKRLKKILKDSNEQITVILYSLYNPYLKAIDKLKKKYKNFQYIVIVPDLPCEYGIESSNRIIRTINRKVGYQSLALAERADGFVFLTEPMNNVVNKKEKPYKIIEGVANDVFLMQGQKNEKPVILYAGNLNKVFGIDKLIEAYQQLEKGSVELWIAGDGDMKDKIQEISKVDGCLKYFGYCSKEDVAKMQSEAWILANPRSRYDGYVQYSFPSKTMEYLSTGKPVAMNKLSCIPSEYYEHLFFFEEETPQSIADTFKSILSLSGAELSERSESQRKFIAEEKSGRAQAKKVQEMKESFFKVD